MRRPLKPLLLPLLFTCLLAPPAAQAADPLPVSAATRQLHEKLLTLDGHMDTPASLDLPDWSILDEHHVHDDYTQVDLPRLKAGGLDGGLWAIYTPQGPLTPEGNPVLRGLSIREMVAASPADFTLATKPGDAAPIAAAGRRVVFISIENAYPLGEDVSLVSLFHKIGVRVIGFAHFAHNQFADSSTDPSGQPKWGGLSPLGKQLLAELNRLGIVPDASHSSDAVLDDLLALSKGPVLLTHSGCKAVYDHPRNIDDDRLRALAAKGGVIMMNAYGAYLRAAKPNPEREKAQRALYTSYREGAKDAAARTAFLEKRREIDRLYPDTDPPSFDDFMAHLLHALKVVGPDHVGIGLDWDGGGGTQGMEDVAAIPRITAALLAAGYKEADLAKIWSGNLLRVMAANQALAR